MPLITTSSSTATSSDKTLLEFAKQTFNNVQKSSQKQMSNDYTYGIPYSLENFLDVPFYFNLSGNDYNAPQIAYVYEDYPTETFESQPLMMIEQPLITTGNDVHFSSWGKKYLKYKIKYLKLKQQSTH
jgi:hypothetical protein